jgi:hypothetical protein
MWCEIVVCSSAEQLWQSAAALQLLQMMNQMIVAQVQAAAVAAG